MIFRRSTSCFWLQALIHCFLFKLICCDCRFPRKGIKNGDILYVEPNDAKKVIAPEFSTIKFRCHTGYRLVGKHYIYCIEGRWGKLPICLEMEKCSDPGISNHGKVQGKCCSPGDTLHYSCLEGYEIIGNKEIRCQETRQWSSSRPLCRPLEGHCELPPAVPHGVVIGSKDGDYYFEGNKVEIFCEPGYKYTGSELNLLCENGNWSAEFGECVEIFCQAPEPPANGIISEMLETKTSTFPYNFKITYGCNEGYRLFRGDSWRFCRENGWTRKTPRCLALEGHCELPPAVPHGVVIGSYDGDYYLEGNKVEIFCEPGYKYTGSELNLLCENGNWSAEFGECVEIFCEAPEPPANGIISEMLETNTSTFPYNFKITYGCNEGYQLFRGDSWRFCRENGWTGKTPRCLALEGHCELPPAVPHGVVIGSYDGDYYLEGNTVEIFCKPGYKYTGSELNLLCENGNWSAEFGECVEIFCEAPEPPANGIISEMLETNTSTFPYNFKITYGCNEGYQLFRGDSWRFCRENGWTGKTPRCLALEGHCELPPAVPHGVVIGSNDGDYYLEGNTVEILCEPGYIYTGSELNLLCENGNWSTEFGECVEIFCEAPEPPANGIISEMLETNTSTFPYNFKITYGCNEGYQLFRGDSWRFCRENGWTGKTPLCLGEFNFNSGAPVRDTLNAGNQEKELQNPLHNGRTSAGGLLDVNSSGRLVLYFVFDVSSSFGKQNFDKSIEFTKSIVRKVKISENKIRVGAIVFNNNAKFVFSPDLLKTTEDVLEALDAIEYTGGESLLFSAFNLLQRNYTSLENEDRKAIVILTDGNTDMAEYAIDAANFLKGVGFDIYSIGISDSVEIVILYKIASTSNGEKSKVFILQNNTSMDSLVQEIVYGEVVLDYPQCGLVMENAGREIDRGRIVGGNQSEQPWPWMAALYAVDEMLNAYFQCGGSIINDKFILTAAHCMYDKYYNEMRSKDDVIVKLGLTDRKNETYLQEYEIEEMFIHPQWRHRKMDYDIALLQLDRNIEFNAFVKPICLPPIELPENSTLYSSDEHGWVIGWGDERRLPASPVKSARLAQFLKEIPLPFQPREKCIQSLVGKRYRFTDRMFCAGGGEGGKLTCKGDSGGPVMQQQLNSAGYPYWTQVGIVSWGLGCGLKNTYGFYTHVQRLRQWIDSTILDALA